MLYDNLYNFNNINKNDINIFFNLINDNNYDIIKYSNNDIINHIFNNYSIFPITDEFFLINKNDLYFIKKKELNTNNDIAINKLISLYNNAINFYN